MQVNNFRRVVSQGQQMIANTQAVLRTQGVRAAKAYYALKYAELETWCRSEVSNKVNFFPMLADCHIEPKRSAEDYKQALAMASDLLVKLYHARDWKTH